MPGTEGGVSGVGPEGRCVGRSQRGAAEGVVELVWPCAALARAVGRRPASALASKVAGFVAARVPADVAATVRIKLHAGSTHVELHWPVGNARELAA